MLNGSDGEVSHRWPQFLPDGRHFIYLMMRGPIASMSVSANALQDNRVIYAASLDSPGRTLLIRGVLRAAYSAGHLLFLRQKTLVAQPFDASSLQLSGEEVPIAERISINPGNGRTGFAVSESGLLMYRREAGNGGRQLVWLDRTGHRVGQFGEPADYGAFHLSPDNRRLAAYVREPRDATQLKIFDVANGAPTSALMFARTQSELAFAWSSDGSRIAYGSAELYQKTTTGVGSAELIVKSAEPKEVGSWSPDDRYLAYTQVSQKSHRDIWMVPTFGDRTPRPFLITDSDEQEPIFSPDGRWIVYKSDKEGGVDGLYARPFPAGDREWKLAGEDSAWPSWRADGKELFYVSRGNLMSIAVNVNRDPTFAAPAKLFAAPISPGRFGQYAVSVDGQRFLMIEPQDAASSAATVPLTVVLNWQARQ
jgi:dipeptidyl aminopeptidase/acylaminoacyl peptidase